MKKSIFDILKLEEGLSKYKVSYKILTYINSNNPSIRRTVCMDILKEVVDDFNQYSKEYFTDLSESNLVPFAVEAFSGKYCNESSTVLEIGHRVDMMINEVERSLGFKLELNLAFNN